MEIPKNVLKAVVENRRYLHKNPELSNYEFETAKFVFEKLESFGLSPKYLVENRGVVCDFGGDGSEPVAFRADMDALPINENSGEEFSSEVPGVMHACGHDCHTAMLLGLAQTLAESGAEIKQPIRFIFQPAEETLDGAEAMMAAGALEGVRKVLGMHVEPDLPVGSVVCQSGTIMASTDRLHIKILGENTHVARPHDGVDAMLVAAKVLLDLQSIVTREVPPGTPLIVSLCEINGGTAHNVVASEVEMVGTIRTHSEDVRAFAKKRVEEIASGIASSSRARAEVSWPKGCPTVVNDHDLTTSVKEAILDSKGIEVLDRGRLNLGGEDFSLYAHRVPGCFLRLGAKAENYPAYNLHSDKLRLNESALEIGLKIWLSVYEGVQAGRL